MFDLNPRTNQFDSVISSTIKETDVVLEYDEINRPIFWKDFISGTFNDSPKCGYNKAKCPVKGNFSISNLIFI